MNYMTLYLKNKVLAYLKTKLIFLLACLDVNKLSKKHMVLGQSSYLTSIRTGYSRVKDKSLVYVNLSLPPEKVLRSHLIALASHSERLQNTSRLLLQYSDSQQSKEQPVSGIVLIFLLSGMDLNKTQRKPQSFKDF